MNNNGIPEGNMPPPIQDSGYSQNQIQMEPQYIPPHKENDNKKILILAGIVLLVVAIVIGYFVLFGGKDKDDSENNTNSNSVTNSNTNTNTNAREEWDPSKSIIKELNDVDAIRLVCTEKTFGLVTDVSQITVIFLYETMRQIIVEESVEFDDNSIEFYDYYVNSLTEVFNDMKNDNDNVVLEVRKKAKAVSLAFSIDLTADIDNIKNTFEYHVVNASMDYYQAREELEIAGYRCQ